MHPRRANVIFMHVRESANFFKGSAMNRFRKRQPTVVSAKPLFLLTLSALLCSSGAAVFLVTDTIVVGGQTAIVRGSSELPGSKTDPTSNVLLHMFDTDSTTCWFEGSQTSGQGEWIEIRFPNKRKIKGMIFGAGCRQDYICLGDNSVPSKIKIRLDEKAPFDFTFDWDAHEGPPSTLTEEEVNMRESLFWFDSDTAFSSTVFQIKFEEVRKGARYDKLAMSDFELIDPSDTRFGLFDILSPLTINPNDLGTINSPGLLIGNDEPGRIKEFVDSVYSQESSADWKQDSAKVDQGINAGMHTISDGNQIAQLITVLKQLLIKNGKMVRFRQEGRVTTYMLQDGAIYLGGKQWDIWRYFSTIQTSKGIELTIRYVPFAN
jgi:hypothetical protein